ncbi:MAG: PDZ domain-containing protein [Planctomycetota bacterium]|nr:PDZ domain-containing protein [Planctomycetota bacterium]
MRCLLPLALLCLAARAEDSLEQPLGDLRAASHNAGAVMVESIVAGQPSLEAVLNALEKGVPVPRDKAGWQTLKAVDEAGTVRPYHLYISEKAHASAEPVPLLVDLHGGIATPNYRPPEAVQYRRQLWEAIADAGGFVIAFPVGRADCAWWTDAGVRHVRACVRDAKRRAHIDDGRIVGAGFSDGGSGCYYMALSGPDPFAAFLPLNGSPAVASGAGGRQLYLRNLRLTPLFVAMTDSDQLYPAKSVLPHLKRALEAGAPIRHFSVPGGHELVYFADKSGEFMKFVADAKRESLPAKLEWLCAEPELGEVRWLKILELGPTAGDAAALPDLNVMTEKGRVRLGVHTSRTFMGPGVSVEKVVEGSAAERMGLKPDDLIFEVDAVPIETLQDLRAALGAKTYGEEVLVKVVRGDEDLLLKGRFPPFKPEPIYPRAKPAAHLTLSAEGNTLTVTSRNVRRFKLLLSPRQFDLSKEIVVTVNGKERLRKKFAPDLAYLLHGYVRNADAGRLFAAEAVIDLK